MPGINPITQLSQQTMVASNDELSGSTLGQYTVDKIIGQGSMGVVYMGKHTITRRPAALKTMLLSDEFDADEIDMARVRFFQEAETAGGLIHPHIVSVFGANEEHGLAYIAMELLSGHDLAHYTKPNNLLPVEQVLDIIENCTLALDYAHQRNVIHRDIKPANVMFDEQTGSLKIMDFGVARITDSNKTRAGVVLGTPSYMSPEQLAGKKLDGRSDLFSLAVMMFQLLTGKLPFQASTIHRLAQKICCEQHAKTSSLRPELHRSIDHIIDKALNKDITQRYQTAGEMANHLRTSREFIRMKSRDG